MVHSGKNTGFKDRAQVYAHWGGCTRTRRDNEGRLKNRAIGVLVQSGMATNLITELDPHTESHDTFVGEIMSFEEENVNFPVNLESIHGNIISTTYTQVLHFF